MRIIGLTKIRNEEAIIEETLDHWGSFCTGGIYVVDDVSTDRTVEICRQHPAVKDILLTEDWDVDRERAEHVNRQRVLSRAQKDAQPDDWFVYFDADERIYFDDWQLLFEKGVCAIACRLFDIYITPADRNFDHNIRKWVGPEFRTIVFFFKNSPYLSYNQPDQRVVNLPPGEKIVVSGIIKHFGKGLSVKHWEETCDYYINFWPKYAAKWQKRKGQAVKKDFLSDFGNKLVKFNDVLDGRVEGFSLEDQVYGKN
jgi:glycosyltransferase involved in cell wall biosynthesis